MSTFRILLSYAHVLDPERFQTIEQIGARLISQKFKFTNVKQSSKVRVQVSAMIIVTSRSRTCQTCLFSLCTPCRLLSLCRHVLVCLLFLPPGISWPFFLFLLTSFTLACPIFSASLLFFRLFPSSLPVPLRA